MQRVIPLGNGFPSVYSDYCVSDELLHRSLQGTEDAIKDMLVSNLLRQYYRQTNVRFKTPPHEAFTIERLDDPVRRRSTYRAYLNPSGVDVELWGKLGEREGIHGMLCGGLSTGDTITTMEQPRIDAADWAAFDSMVVQSIRVTWQLVGVNDHTGKRVYARVD